MGKRAQQLLLLMASLVLLFLGLESFPLWQQFMPESPKVHIQGVFPRQLPPDQSHLVQVHYSAPSQSKLSIELASHNAPPLKVNFKPTKTPYLWQALMPPLTQGVYKASLQSQWPTSQFKQGPFLLNVAPPQIQTVRSIQDIYQQGQTLQFNGWVSPLPKSLLQLKITGPKQIEEPLEFNDFGIAQWMKKSDESWEPGLYHAQILKAHHPLGKRVPFQISTPQTPSQVKKKKFKVFFPQHHVLKDKKNTLPVEVFYENGSPLNEGWLRLGNATFVIQKGQGEFEVLPTTSKGKIDFHVGDNQGLIEQGSYTYQASQDMAVVPHFKSFNLSHKRMEWSLQATHKDPVIFVFGQGSDFYQQGQVIPGQKWSVRIPPQAQLDQPFWLSLTTMGEVPKSHHIDWSFPQSSLRRSPPFQTSTQRPHALEKVQLSFQKRLKEPVFLELTQSVTTGDPLPSSASPNPVYQFQSPPLAPMYNKGVLSGLYAICFFIFSFWPLARVGFRTRHQSIKTPIHPLLIGISLSFIVGVALSLQSGFMSGLIVLWCIQGLACGLLCLPQMHPKILGWRSSILGFHLHMGVVFWALSIYHPQLLPAYFFTGALSWWLLSRFMSNEKVTLQSISLGVLGLSLIGYLGWAWLIPQPLLHETPTLSTRHLTLDTGHKARQVISYQTETLTPRKSQVHLNPTFQKSPHFLAWRMLSKTGTLQYGETLFETQAAVMPSLDIPLFALKGDILGIPLKFNNETLRKEKVHYRLNRSRYQSVTIPPGQSTEKLFPLSFKRTGVQKIVLDSYYKGTKTSKEKTMYVKARQPEVQDPDFDFDVRIPKDQKWKLGSEFPVRVQFSHRLPETTALGFQIGIPTGYRVYPETLQDKHHRRWLKDFNIVPGYINIRTHPIVPIQAFRFHIRFKVNSQGILNMPTSSIFVLKEPKKRKSVYASETLDSLSSR